MDFGYTQDEELEFRRCKSDFVYFCETYVKITHPSDGQIPFRLYGYQKRVFEEFEKNKFDIVKKFRQAGLTTLAAIWCMWRCLFRLDQKIMITSKTDREAIGVGATVQNVIDNLPEWLRSRMKSSSKHEKVFTDTNSVMWFYTPEAARSKSLTILVIDEAAFIKNMYEHWKAAYPTISGGGGVIVVSTVNGIGNWFHETYKKAQDKKNKFHVIDLDYREHPEYCKPEWVKQTRSNIGEKEWMQEYLGQFLGSGDTYIDQKIILDLEKKCIPPTSKLFPEWDPNIEFESISEENPDKLLLNDGYEKGAMWVWKDPQLSKDYIIASDCGDGQDNDYSAFVVLDSKNLEQVAEFYSNSIPTHKFAQVLYEVGLMYNEALIVTENDSGPGLAVLNRIEHTLRYPNLYYQNKGNREKVGLTMSRTNRPLVMETLHTCLFNKIVKIRSVRIVRELGTFLYNKTKQRPEASRGSHDDLIMALGIALYITDVQVRNVPAGYDMSPTDKISEIFNGTSLNEIKAAMESAIKLEEIPEELEDLLAFDRMKSYVPRMNDDLLKEFGF